jgi:alpha-ketoglutarate-dependent taurine dioxygenase
MKFTNATGTDIDPSEVPGAINTYGIAFFRDADVSTLQASLSSWTIPYGHPHENTPGLTLLSANRQDRHAGLKGFTREQLTLHTDRASNDAPPTLMALLILEPPDAGGKTVLADTAPLIGELKSHPEFDDIKASAFLASDNQKWPILERTTHERYRFRFRNDEVARPHSARKEGELLLRALEQLCSHPRTVELRSGEGYLLHNARYLHGRQEFQGRRTVARFLADTSLLSLDHGFQARA